MTAIASALEYAYKGKVSLHWFSAKMRQPSCSFELSSFAPYQSDDNTFL